MDGSNILLHDGKVYGRSVSAPSEGKWMAMVKKHHAWKVTGPDVYLYGDRDIYGVHSIAYGPVPEDRTFFAFALRDATGAFASFARDASRHGIPRPVQGNLSLGFGDSGVLGPAPRRSTLGGAEGVVGGPWISRIAFNAAVRAGHVQSDEHWTADALQDRPQLRISGCRLRSAPADRLRRHPCTRHPDRRPCRTAMSGVQSTAPTQLNPANPNPAPPAGVSGSPARRARPANPRRGGAAPRSGRGRAGGR